MKTLVQKPIRPAARRGWAALSKRNWTELLAAQPQFADRCDKWGELDGDCWAWLLGKQPQFAGKCDWRRLNGDDWTVVLKAQPQFAGECDRAGQFAVVSGVVS